MLPLVVGVPLLKTLGAAITSALIAKTADHFVNTVIPYGNNCNDGSHDHRTNRGTDRTPAQKNGDKKRRKNFMFFK